MTSTLNDDSLSPIWLSTAIGLTAALILLSSCASRPIAQPPIPPRNIQAEVTAEFERSIGGWNSGQIDVFLGIYAEDATFALRDRFLQGNPAIRAYYIPQFLPGVQRGVLRFDQFEVQALGLDLVLVRAIYQNRPPDGEPIRGTTTLLMRHIDGRWRIIHDHST